MAQFPPKTAQRKAPTPPKEAVKNPVSTGKGGIPASLRVKNAGSKDAPGVEKTVNKF